MTALEIARHFHKHQGEWKPSSAFESYKRTHLSTSSSNNSNLSWPGLTSQDYSYRIIHRSTVILVRTEKPCKCRSAGDWDIPGSITWNVRRRKYISVIVYVNKVSWKLHKKLIRAWGCSSVVKHLSSMHKALGLISNAKITKKMNE